MGYFQKFSFVSETQDMTSEGLGEMFESDFIDKEICQKISIHVDGGPSSGQARTDPGAGTSAV